MRASGAAKTFEIPRLEPACKRLAAERIGEPFRRHADRRPVERDQRDELARLPRQPPLRPDDAHRRVAEQRVDFDGGEPRACKQCQLADQVVEPLAGGAQHEQPPRLEGERCVERQLEIRRVLVGRMTLGAHARRVGLDRVEVAHDERRRQPCRARMIGACIRGDDRGSLRHRLDGRRPKWAGTGNDDDGVGHGASQPHRANPAKGGARTGAAPQRLPY